MMNRPLLSDVAACTSDTRVLCSGISATREDFSGVPSDAAATRPVTVHRGGCFSASLEICGAGFCVSRVRAATLVTSAGNIPPVLTDVLVELILLLFSPSGNQ